MSFDIENLSSGANVDFGTCGCRFNAAEAAGHSTHEAEKPDPNDDGWQVLGSVTIDTGTLLLIDEVHHDADVTQMGESDCAQVPIPGGDFSAVAVATGMGDGRYPVEGRFADCPLGRRIAEIRVRFFDDEGNYLGGDNDTSDLHEGS